MFELDHIAVSASSLEDGVDWVQDILGVSLQPGGKHAHYATHNALLGLGDIYLEVITSDPSAAALRPRWFGLDKFSGPAKLSNWICRGDQSTNPELTGPAVALQRDDLTWSLTVPDSGDLPMGGGYPTLIKWGDGVPHPATSLRDVGCRLDALVVKHPQADWLRANVPLADQRIRFQTAGTAEFEAQIMTPTGPKVLS